MTYEELLAENFHLRARIREFKPLRASLERITGHCDHTCLLFGKNPDLGHDLHILIVLSR